MPMIDEPPWPFLMTPRQSACADIVNVAAMAFVVWASSYAKRKLTCLFGKDC
jgi:hypothetical protein